MIDITAPKVLSPALLFAVLTPGLLLAVPPGSGLFVQVCMHALILCVFNFLIIRYGFHLNVTTTDIIVPGVLFVMLSPDVLLTLPHLSLPTATGVHTLLFAFIWAGLRGQFPEYA